MKKTLANEKVPEIKYNRLQVRVTEDVFEAMQKFGKDTGAKMSPLAAKFIRDGLIKWDYIKETNDM